MDITKQKSSLSASASRLTEAGRKSYLFSVSRTEQHGVNTSWKKQYFCMSLCVTCVRREFKQQDATGPQDYKAQTKNQSVD